MRRSRAFRLRTLLPVLATVVVVGPLGWMWASSFVPSSYSATEMGYVDDGGAPLPGGHVHGDAAGGVPVAALTGDVDGPADVAVTLVARQEHFRLASGEDVDGYTLNGETPGPTIRARAGDLVEVRVANDNVKGGITLHWHGVDVPNSMDGVAGVTQDAIRPGQHHVYRFIAVVGTYWYHSHQLSHPQVAGGLLGALVVSPRAPRPGVLDVVALVHFYGGVRTVNGRPLEHLHPASPETTARVRVINTDQGPMPVWVSGASYRVVAVDGQEVNRPTPITSQAVLVTAGGRADLELVVPAGGARVEFAGASVGARRTGARRPAPRRPEPAGPVALRQPDAVGLRPGQGRPHVRLRDRSRLRAD